jgi:hypothetical protein
MYSNLENNTSNNNEQFMHALKGKKKITMKIILILNLNSYFSWRRRGWKD